MRFAKKESDAVAAVLDAEEMKRAREIISDSGVRGWSVFDRDGVIVYSQGVSETAVAVASNAIDLATGIGSELNESDTRPTMTFMKGAREMHAETFARANMIVMREKGSASGRESHNVR